MYKGRARSSGHCDTPGSEILSFLEAADMTVSSRENKRDYDTVVMLLYLLYSRASEAVTRLRSIMVWSMLNVLELEANKQMQLLRSRNDKRLIIKLL